MKRIKEKTKEFVEQNKKELVTGFLIGLVGGCMTVYGYQKGWKNHEDLISKGLMEAVDTGFIILTKPSGDGSITKLTIDEWCKEISETV